MEFSKPLMLAEGIRNMPDLFNSPIGSKSGDMKRMEKKQRSARHHLFTAMWNEELEDQNKPSSFGDNFIARKIHSGPQNIGQNSCASPKQPYFKLSPMKRNTNLHSQQHQAEQWSLRSFTKMSTTLECHLLDSIDQMNQDENKCYQKPSSDIDRLSFLFNEMSIFDDTKYSNSRGKSNGCLHKVRNVKFNDHQRRMTKHHASKERRTTIGELREIRKYQQKPSGYLAGKSGVIKTNGKRRANDFVEEDILVDDVSGKFYRCHQ
uniref:Uncharacterized protein n=1 Tax=Clytia hemisphaerica TaxID=252671 RepID=A0A7M5UK27_9CNID